MHNEPFLRFAASLPWCPIKPGFSIKVLHGSQDDDTRALLLRLAPGTRIERHRHGGEVHAVNLRGSRQLDSGEIVGPGDYVYEPPGNVDSWSAIGDEECIVFVTVRGAYEDLDAKGNVTHCSTTRSADGYRRFLEGVR